MPIIPRGSTGVQQRPALPSTRLAPSAPGTAFQAPPPPDLRGVEQVVEKIVEKERNRANQLAVLDADRQLSALETELLYHPERGFLNRQGKLAFESPGSVLGEFQQRSSEIAGQLGNDEQRLVVEQMIARREGDLNSAVQRHVSSERQKFDDETTEAYLANERQSAIAAYSDDERVQRSIKLQRAAVLDYADHHGKSDAWREQKLSEVTSQTHVGIIDRMLTNEQDQAAAAYFTKYRDEVRGNDAEKVEKALMEGTLRGESQRRADTIVEQHRDRGAALEVARKITDPKLRDATEDRVNKYFSEQRAIEQEQENDIYLAATNLVDKNPGRAPRDLVAAPQWAKLSLAARNALEARAEQGPQNNDKVWLNFLDLRPETLGRMEQPEFEIKYWSRFDREHRARAEQQWAAARDAMKKPGGIDTSKLSTTMTFQDRVDNTLRRTGLIPAKKTRSEFNDLEARTYVAFENEAARRVENFELTSLLNKRKATGEEIQDIIDKMSIEKVFVNEWFRDPELQSSVLTPDQRGNAYVPLKKIPQEDANKIRNRIKSAGRRITDDKIQRAYAAYLLNDRELFDKIIIE